MVSISSMPELGPEAKNTAGSPGSTRINRKVKTSTPKNAGNEDRKRLRCPDDRCAKGRHLTLLVVMDPLKVNSPTSEIQRR